MNTEEIIAEVLTLIPEENRNHAGSLLSQLVPGVGSMPMAVDDHAQVGQKETRRLMSQSRMILKYLCRHRKATSSELIAASGTMRLGARIADARRTLEGTSWTIRSRQVSELRGIWEYELVRK